MLAAFRRAGERLGQPLRLVAADARPDLSSACQLADAHFAVPDCMSGEFPAAMADLCAREGVRLVVPTIDPELLPWARLAPALAAAGVTVAVADAGTVEDCRDKVRTMAALAAAGVPVPRALSEDERAAGRADFPVIFKPRDGSGSRGLQRVVAGDPFPAAAADPAFLAQEWWQGREFTVNGFVDRAGRLVTAVPHERLEVRAGEVSRGCTARVPALLAAAAGVVRAFPGLRGPFCFQAIVRPDGAAAVFEVNARFGGGYPLADAAGAPFAEWLLREGLGLPLPAVPAWREGLTMLRYDQSVFLERPVG